MSTKSKVLIIALAVSVVLLVTGLTYAYFTATVTGEGNDVTVSAADLKSTFTDGPVINESNIEPGWTYNKDITVENTGSKEVNYKLTWENLTNTFINKSNLVYRFESIDGSTCPFTATNVSIPDSGENIQIGTAVINAGETHKCKVVFEYQESSTDQSSDMAKSFNGKFKVSDIRS